MARRRKHANRDLPPNLYVRNNGYYCYRDPRTGTEYGVGSVKRIAINQAIEANMAIIEAEAQNRLIDRINGANILSFSDWLDRYQEVINSRGLKEKTLKDYTSRISTFKEYFTDTTLQDITTKNIAEFLNKYTSQGKAASARLLRSTMLDIFREAIAEGHIQTNPVESTRNPRVEVKRERLSLEVFHAIRLASERFSP